MIYNLELFGKKLKEIRKSLLLNQSEIAKATNIDDRTIRRIEQGKVLPKLDTLELLSPIFKEDLISLLIQYRFDDYSVFYEIHNRIEVKLDGGGLYNLHSEFEALGILLSSTKNLYYKNLINQLLLFTQAIILYKDNNNNNIVLNIFVEALKITTPAFVLENYDLLVYSSMEIRILMNIAFVFNRLNDKEKYIEILDFCINSISTDDEMYPKICHNLAVAYTRNKNFQQSLIYSSMGIKSCQENRRFNGLSLLYYVKGIAEYKLNKEDYLESLKTSIYLCIAFGQIQLKNTIINNCKEVFGINL